jgi:uncharacterized protein (DUF58 family)
MKVTPSTIPRLSQGALELSARRAVEGLYAGRHRSPYTGSAVEFSDHRTYQPGDDLRTIDWKAYGRSDHLLIRRYREERDLPLVLIIDNSASMDYGQPHKGEWASVALAALALLAIDQGDRVRVMIGEQLDMPEMGGPTALKQVCHYLSSCSWSGTATLSNSIEPLLARLTHRAMIIYVSDLLFTPNALQRATQIISARGHELAVIHVLDRSEIALPETWGQCVIRDPEQGVPDVACDAEAAKPSFDAAMAEHIRHCRMILAASRADHHVGVTDQPVTDIIGQWLHRRRSRVC